MRPLSVQDLAEKLAAAAAGGESDTQFIDVREEGELRLAALPRFELFPLSRHGARGLVISHRGWRCRGCWWGSFGGRRWFLP